MRKIGNEGEKIAENFLLNKGYTIITRNFYSRFGEIDLIAKEKSTIVFVEVKFRRGNSFGTPLESITARKLQKIQKTAFYFLTLKGLNNFPFRIDAIEIESDENGKMKIEQVENITL